MLVVLARIERLVQQAAAPASGESRGLTTVETLPDAPADTNADRQATFLLAGILSQCDPVIRTDRPI